VHVLGYFVDTASARLRTFLDAQRDERLRRVREMGERLEALGCPVDVAPILASAARGRSVGRPQIAAALLAAGYVATRDEAFDRFLEHGGPAYVPRRGASAAEVIAIVHDAGGVASLAHPGVLRRDELIAPLAAAGLDGLEALHSDHDATVEARYRALARELGLLVTGGSDFHGDVQHRATRFGALSMSPLELDALRRAAERRRQSH
jgi:predicted metal-dependent phosphoesterase TrpH